MYVLPRKFRKTDKKSDVRDPLFIGHMYSKGFDGNIQAIKHLLPLMIHSGYFRVTDIKFVVRKMKENDSSCYLFFFKTQ